MKPSRQVIWLMWILAVGFFAYQFVLRVSASAIMDDLMIHFNITSIDVGAFSAFYYIGYAGMQIPAGILLDRFNPRYVMTGFILSAVLGSFLVICSTSWPIALAGRFLIGVGSAAGFLGVVKVTKMWFPQDRYATMIGIAVTLGLLGAVYGGGPISAYVSEFTWQPVIQNLALVGLALATLAFFIISEPNTPVQKGGVDPNHPSSVKEALSAIIKKPRLLMIGVLGGLLVGPFEGFADLWGASFFTNVYGLDKTDASFASSLIFFGMVFGSPFLAYLADRYNCTWGLTSLSALGMAVIFTILLSFQSMSYPLVLALMFTVGIFSCYQILVFAMAVDMVDVRLTALVTAVIQTLNLSIGCIFHVTTGWGLDFIKSMNLPEDHFYNQYAYSFALSCIPIALFIGFIGFMIMTPKKQQKPVLA